MTEPQAAAMVKYAKAKSEDGTLVAYYETLRTSTDPEDRWRWSQVCASYGVGLPGKRPETATTDNESTLDAVWARRRAAGGSAPACEADPMNTAAARDIATLMARHAPAAPPVEAPEPTSEPIAPPPADEPGPPRETLLLADVEYRYAEHPLALRPILGRGWK